MNDLGIISSGDDDRGEERHVKVRAAMEAS